MKLFRESRFAPNFALPAQSYASFPSTAALLLPATIHPPVLGRRAIRINDVVFGRIPHEADVPYPLPPLVPPHEADVPLPLRLLHLIHTAAAASITQHFRIRATTWHFQSQAFAAVCVSMKQAPPLV